jgi:hypothetical protein
VAFLAITSISMYGELFNELRGSGSDLKAGSYTAAVLSATRIAGEHLWHRHRGVVRHPIRGAVDPVVVLILMAASLRSDRAAATACEAIANMVRSGIAPSACADAAALAMTIGCRAVDHLVARRPVSRATDGVGAEPAGGFLSRCAAFLRYFRGKGLSDDPSVLLVRALLPPPSALLAQEL